MEILDTMVYIGHIFNGHISRLAVLHHDSLLLKHRILVSKKIEGICNV